MNYKVWAPNLGMQPENARDVYNCTTSRDAAEYFVRSGMAHGQGVHEGEVLVHVLAEDWGAAPSIKRYVVSARTIVIHVAEERI